MLCCVYNAVLAHELLIAYAAFFLMQNHSKALLREKNIPFSKDLFPDPKIVDSLSAFCQKHLKHQNHSKIIWVLNRTTTITVYKFEDIHTIFWQTVNYSDSCVKLLLWRRRSHFVMSCDHLIRKLYPTISHYFVVTYLADLPLTEFKPHVYINWAKTDLLWKRIILQSNRKICFFSWDSDILYFQSSVLIIQSVLHTCVCQLSVS